MGYVLSEIQPPDCIKRAIYANIFDEKKPSLVINKVNLLEFYRVHTQSEDPSVEIIDLLTIEESILAITSFRPPKMDTDWLLVLTQAYSLFYVGYNSKTGNFVRVDGGRLNSLGQQNLLDVDPIILSKFDGESGYFLVHCFQGMVQLLKVNTKIAFNTLLSETKNSGSRKRSPHLELWDLNTFAIGNIAVHQMVLLQNTKQSQDTLSVLYRDFQYNYSLRYYAVQLDIKKFELLTQFEEFDEPPSCIISPEKGGLLVLTSLHIFYFPNPGVRLHLINETDNLFLSNNNDGQLVVKKLNSIEDPGLLSSSFSHYTIIDDTRILANNDTGMSYILYFNSELKNETNIFVNAINLIKLGKTTVASSVHHIDKNLFFASSKLSQSILFQVLQTSPFINICQFIPSSPPLLDVDMKFIRGNPSLLSCGGGYDSGEFRKVGGAVYELKQENIFSADLDANELLLLHAKNDMYHIATKDMNGNINGEYSIEGKGDCSNFKPLSTFSEQHSERILDVKIVCSDKIFITNKGCYINDQVVANQEVKACKILLNGIFVFVNSDNEVVIQSGSSVLIRFLLAHKNLQTSCFDLIKISEDEYLLLVAYQDNIYELHKISTDTPHSQLLIKDKLYDSLEIYSCAISFDAILYPGMVWLLFLTENGSIVQINFKLQTGPKDKLIIVSHRLSQYPFKFLKSKTFTLIVNQKELICLIFDKTSCFFKFSATMEVGNINSAIFLNDSDLLISSGINKLTWYSLQNKSNEMVIFSDLLNLKSLHVPNTNYSVIICFENKINPINDEYQKYSYVKLVEDSNMKVLDTFSFGKNESWDLVDICLIPNVIESMIPKNSFVILCNSPNNNEILLMFSIEKNKIHKRHHMEISGLTESSELVLRTIEPIDSESLKFIVGGNVTFVVELLYDQDKYSFSWKVVPGSIIQLPMHALGAAVANKYVVIGDIMKGIYGGRFIEDEELENHSLAVLKISYPLDPFFLTAFDTSVNEKLENKVEIIFGDSLGNLSCLHVNKDDNDADQVFAFNIGDQINVVKSVESPNLKQDFISNFESCGKNRSISYILAVIGTLHGGLYCISKLEESTAEHIEGILKKCLVELASYQKTLSINNKGKKMTSYDMWLSRRDWKTLHKDETGVYLTKESYGMTDLGLVKKWLDLDSQLTCSDQTKGCQELLSDLETNLKTCYRNKRLLQRLVYESSLF